MLKRAGYDTGCFGKWHLGYREQFWPIQHGFDESFGILGGNADYFTHIEEGGRHAVFHNAQPAKREGYLTDLFAEAAIDWLKKRPSGRPFFLYVPFTAPHTPIQDPDGDGTRRQGDRPIYAKMVERMDARIGDILGQLRAMKADENTLVLFLSDNGADSNGRNAPYRGHKGSVWEGGIRIPLLMRWLGVLAEGGTAGQLTLTMDLTPTLLAAAGASSNRKFDGLNLLPVIKGEKPAFSRRVFWRYKRLERRLKAARDGDWKLVDENGRKALHNLAQDPYEQKDLLAEHPQIARDLEASLAAWERDVQAPRLRGFRPTVSGASGRAGPATR
jgi:N-acetylgalactosamine-6-sulfatase